MTTTRSVYRALSYLCVALAIVLILNLIPLLEGKYHTAHFVSSGILLVCIMPLFIYLIRPTGRIPWMEMICLVYALQYATFPFLGLSPWYRLAYLNLNDTVYTQWLTLAGILMLVLGYYTQPIRIFLLWLPPLQMEWNPRQVKLLSLGFLAVGCVALIMIKTGRSFPGGAQITFFVSKLAVVGILALFLLQLRGQLGFIYGLLLWGALIPIYLLMAISGGNSAPIALFVISVLMVFVSERARIPWAIILVGLVLLFPFMYAKHEYRYRVWTDLGGAKFRSMEDAVSNALIFVDLAKDSLTDQSGEKRDLALQTIASRFDITYLFAHVRRLTPSEVPYLGGESYNDIWWKFVPRAIFPDKPDPDYGQIFGHMYNILAIDDFTTAINFPQLVEMYVNFGPTGVLIGMFLIAQIYRIIDHLMNARRGGDWLTVFGASVISGLFAIESNFSLVVAGVVYHIVLFYFIGFFVRVTPKR